MERLKTESKTGSLPENLERLAQDKDKDKI